MAFSYVNNPDPIMFSIGPGDGVVRGWPEPVKSAPSSHSGMISKMVDH